MSDRFDITFDHMVDTKPSGDNAGDGARPARRVEVITDAGRRRQWSTDEKARILFESLVPGANVSAVARRHAMIPQQLFGWRKEAREQMAADMKVKPSPGRREASATNTPAPTAPAFVPVMIAAQPASAVAAAAPPPPPPPAAPCAGRIEIVVGDCLVRVCGDVDTKTLSVVLAAVRKPR